MATERQLLEDITGKNGFVILASTDGEVEASDLGYDEFVGLIAHNGTSATAKTLSKIQAEISSVVKSDFSTTGVYSTGAAATILPQEYIEHEFTKITVGSGLVRAYLGRRTIALAAAQPK
jgi:hypothetical protein